MLRLLKCNAISRLPLTLVSLSKDGNMERKEEKPVPHSKARLMNSISPVKSDIILLKRYAC